MNIAPTHTVKTLKFTASENAERAAVEILTGDWDAQGTVSVHLPTNAAMMLAARLGWTRGKQGNCDVWISAHGRRAYSVGEAIEFALLSGCA